jgi:hypothetical protein
MKVTRTTGEFLQLTQFRFGSSDSRYAVLIHSGQAAFEQNRLFYGKL